MTNVPLIDYGDKIKKQLSTIEIQQCNAMGYFVRKKRFYEVDNNISITSFSFINMNKFYIQKLGYETPHLNNNVLSSSFNEIEEV